MAAAYRGGCAIQKWLLAVAASGGCKREISSVNMFMDLEV